MGAPPLRRSRGDLTLIGFVAAACAVLVLLAGTWRLSVQQRQAMAWADESQEVLQVIANTRAALIDIQNGHRGFTIEGTEEALQPYRQGTTAIRGESARLRALLKDTPEQDANLAELERLLPQRLATAAQLVEARRSGGFEAAKEIVDTGWPAEQMAALRGVLQRMEAQQQALSQERMRLQEESLTRFSAGVAGVALLLPLSLGILYVQVRRRRADQLHLVESEERFRLMTESVFDHAIVMLDPGGRVRTWNEGAGRLLGYGDDILGKDLHLSAFHPQEDGHSGRPAELLRLAGERGHCADEGWRVRADGSRFWASTMLSAIHDADGSFRGFCLVVRDLTERRAADQALREQMEERARIAEELRNLNRSLESQVAGRTSELQQANLELELARSRLEDLSARLIEGQEQERRRVAHELHEEMGQVLTAIRMDLIEARRGIDADRRLADAIALMDSVIAQMRGMVGRLRPIMLDDLGLADAIEWELQQHAKRCAWTVRLDVDPELPALSPSVETACFRIAQECLANVAHHAHAIRVGVTLRAVEGQLELTIEDDGIGFDLQQHRGASERPDHFGIVAMEERARLVGGTLEIDTGRGRGVRVRVRVPPQGEKGSSLRLVA